MWLLSTDRAELHYLSSPESVQGGYAILSHVWGSQEQTLQDLQRLRAHCAKTGAIPRDHTLPKIKESCILAERHGYKWIWNDTCCIDKTSSAELSEAINSMFHYYARAEVCYAYLRDVPADDNLHDSGSAFRKSRWWTRGWTLQELIAPALLIFLSEDWRILGTKGDLAPLVEEITRIPTVVLRLETPLDDVSVAKRMSWAAERQATRLEDEAYCLMGIFGVNMPTLYGEGRRAFRRLQEEIMKLTTDTSLFVWGNSTTPDGLRSAVGYCDVERAHTDVDSFLFAPAPSAFKGSSNVSYDPPRTVEYKIPPSGDRPVAVTSLVKIPTFTIEPYAVHAHVPVLEISGLTVAVIFCTAPSQMALGLILTPCHMQSDPSRPLYHTGGRLETPNNNPPTRFRICALNSAFHAPSFTGSKSSWKDVYITHLPQPATDAGPVLLKRMVGSLSTPFRFSRGEMERLQERGFFLDPDLTTTYNWQGPSNSRATVALVFKKRDESAEREVYMEILLGRCQSEHSASAHWATVRFHDERPAAFHSFVHSCPGDHVSQWLHSTKAFEAPRSRASEDSEWNGRCVVSLSVTPCPMNPTETRVVKVSVADDRLAVMGVVHR